MRLYTTRFQRWSSPKFLIGESYGTTRPAGYYDLATPYFATEYTFNHLGLDPSLQDNISMHYL